MMSGRSGLSGETRGSADDKPVKETTTPAAEPRGRGAPQKPGERGGGKGPEPTRYGDWEVGGRCTDF
ncbi:succinate dehydrogenase assembly factor 4 [Fodinicurvata sp. EGI_FJ10296]|uniref:succinate dehydrogenase assembly factor 4 n=1 Tax=Fodinicurvata sp. EGI_FJ10296 TaxID=3231908 RepID=UPI0034555424